VWDGFILHPSTVGTDEVLPVISHYKDIGLDVFTTHLHLMPRCRQAGRGLCVKNEHRSSARAGDDKASPRGRGRGRGGRNVPIAAVVGAADLAPEASR
jgi:hypothetical protein